MEEYFVVKMDTGKRNYGMRLPNETVDKIKVVEETYDVKDSFCRLIDSMYDSIQKNQPYTKNIQNVNEIETEHKHFINSNTDVHTEVKQEEPVITNVSTDPKSELYLKNKKLYSKLLNSYIKKGDEGYPYKVEKDPTSNGILKYDIIKNDGNTLNIRIYKEMINEIPVDCYPIFLDTSNYKEDEQSIENWIKYGEFNVE